MSEQLPIRARRVPGRDDLVLFEIGAPPDGPHWIVSVADAQALGWGLIDAAIGHVVALTVTEMHA